MGKGVKSGTIIGIMFAIVFVIALGSAIISRLNMNNYLEDGPPEEAAETEGAALDGVPKAARGLAFARTFQAPPDGLTRIDAPIETADGLQGWDDFEGQWTVLNLWATWCAPCLWELPDFDALAGALEGHDIQVIALQTGPMGDTEVSLEAARAEFEKLGVTRLPVRVDGSEDRAAYMNALAYWRDGGKFAMPTTLLLNPAGEIVGVTSGARIEMTGDEPLDVKSTKPGDVKTHWAKEEAAEFLKAVAAEA